MQMGNLGGIMGKLFSLLVVCLGAYHVALADVSSEQNKHLIENCIAQPAVISAWRVSSNSSSDRVFVSEGKIYIELGVQLRYQHYFSSEEFTQAVQLMEGAREEIEKYYASQGVYLQLTFDHARYDATSRAGHPQPQNRDHVVYIRRETGEHMKSVYWGVNFSWSQKDRGAILSHEVAHLMGLKDEYETRLAERIGEEDNIMNNWDAPGARFYPHQIAQLIAPICGE